METKNYELILRPHTVQLCICVSLSVLSTVSALPLQCYSDE